MGKRKVGQLRQNGIDIYTLPCVKQTVNGNLLYSIGSSAWCCDDLNGRDAGWRGRGGEVGVRSERGDMFPGGSDGKELTSNAGDLGLIPKLGRCPGEGNGNSLPYSCLENSMDRGAWWATIHEVAKS